MVDHRMATHVTLAGYMVRMYNVMYDVGKLCLMHAHRCAHSREMSVSSAEDLAH